LSGGVGGAGRPREGGARAPVLSIPRHGRVVDPPCDLSAGLAAGGGGGEGDGGARGLGRALVRRHGGDGGRRRRGDREAGELEARSEERRVGAAGSPGGESSGGDGGAGRPREGGARAPVLGSEQPGRV